MHRRRNHADLFIILWVLIAALIFSLAVSFNRHTRYVMLILPGFILAAGVGGDMIYGKTVKILSEKNLSKKRFEYLRAASFGIILLLIIPPVVITTTQGPYYSLYVNQIGGGEEKDGYYLNDGLISQKEGFGARAVVHDFYEIDIK